ITDSATIIVTPMTFQLLSRHEVYVDTFSVSNHDQVSHVDLSELAEISIIAPATANTIGKMTYDLADSFVTSTVLATDSHIFVIPEMNTDMFENPATQENIQTLKNRGVYVVDPDTGFLAEGYEGKGRYPENERILEELENFIMTKDMTLPLRGYKILISAGGTKERIDPVRYITNDSSGKMGHAIAEAAYQYGAEVTLVTTSALNTSKAIERVQVDSAKAMFEAIDERFDDLDIL